MRKSFWARAVAGLAMPGLLLPAVALAGTRNFAAQGYQLPADKSLSIVMMRPDVDVGELQAGGLPQPNADWTRQARENLEVALRDELAVRKLDFRTMESQLGLRASEAQALADRCEAAKIARAAAEKALAAPAAPLATTPAIGKRGAPAATPATAPVPAPALPAIPAECAAPPAPFAGADAVAEYTALHGAVVQAILEHKYGMGGGKLPTKKADFDYTMGNGTAVLGKLSGANYGLFVQTFDQFASASRKTMQVAGMLGCLVGVCMIVSGGIHVAYVSLVDLDTGKVVWFNLLRGSQGDIRETAGAHGLAKAILATMPDRPGAPVTQVAQKDAK